jgi:Fe-S-cluster containining protein
MLSTSRKNPIYSELHQGNGICRYFDSENKNRSIYQDRPLLCRIDEEYPVLFSKDYSLKEYYALIQESCSYLQSLTPK